MSNFLYELPDLTHCKHFVDIILPIIVIFTLRNIIFFVLMKKQNFIMRYKWWEHNTIF